MQTYQSGSVVIKIQIIKKEVTFTNIDYGFRRYFPINKLFSIRGFVKEYPDLKGKEKEEVWEIGMDRWKDVIEKLGREDNIAEFLCKELGLMGFSLVKEFQK